MCPSGVVVVVTDGESAPYDTEALRQALSNGPPTKFVWSSPAMPSERVWYRGRAIRDYRPKAERDAIVKQFAEATGAEVFARGPLAGAVRAVRAASGSGRVDSVGTQLEIMPLGRWFVLASLVPLGFLLWRRNVV